MKTFNFFEKLWEHSRTLRRVGLVLVMCLITITQAYAYSIWGAKTIYVDNLIAEWEQPEMQVYKNEGTKPSYRFTQIGTTSFWYYYFSSDWDGYDHIYYYNYVNDAWGNKSAQQKYDVHPSSFAVVVPKSGDEGCAIGYFTDTKKANPDHRIYFDATPIAGWGSSAYLRYGFDCVAHADPMTKFPGTANLFYIDCKEAYYEKYTVANAAGYTKANTVYQPTSKCKPTGDYAITKSLNFSDTDIDGGSSKVLSFIPTSKASTSEGCDWWNYTKNTNTSIPTKTVTVNSTTNGKIRVDYYNTSGTSTYWEGSGGTSLTVPQSAIITVTATGNTGYNVNTLSVGGAAFTSGNTYTVTAATTISATFTGITYTVDLNTDCSSSVSPTSLRPVYNSNLGTSTVVSSVGSFSGYTFQGFFTDHAGAGVELIGSDKKWKKSVSGYTDGTPHWIHADDVTLYAKWTTSVKLDKNTGSSDGSVTATYKGGMATPSAPTYSGYTADGYYAESGCSTYVMATDGTLQTGVTNWTDANAKWIKTGSSQKLYTKWKINAPSITCSRNTVTISTVAAGTTIYYTTDGSTPTTTSSVYDPSNKPTIAANTTVKAFATKSGCTNSDVTVESLTYVTPYTISYDANLDGAGGTTADQTNNFTGDQVATSACGFSKSGYKFKWWNTKDDGTGEDFYVGEKVTIASADVTLYAVWETVGSGYAFWCGENVTKDSYADITGNGCTMRLTSTGVDNNTNLTDGTTYVNKYNSTTEKHAKVLAIDTKNTKYLTVEFTDGSPINSLELGVCNKGGTNEMLVIYSTTSDFSSGVGEKVAKNTSKYTQATKAVIDFSPSTSNKYKYARVYMQLDGDGVYGQTGGSANIIRIYSIKAQKGTACGPNGLAYETATVNKTYGDAAFTNTLTNAHSLAVSYSSGDDDVATVNSSNGQVTIKGAGSTTITATWAGNVTYCAGSVDYTLNVAKADITPSVSYASVGGTTLTVGETSSGSPTISGNPGDGTVTYSSSDPSVASVNETTGVVTAEAAGTATITATIAATANYNGNTATAEFTVNAACSATQPGTISKGTASGGTGSITLTAAGEPASNNTWYWQASSDGTSTSESGATKNVSAAGTYHIRSYCSDGSGCWSEAQSVTVTAADLLTPITPSLTYANTVTYGSTISPTLTGNAGSGTVTYSLNDVTPAGSLTINSSTGVVTGATAGGTATVTATIAEKGNYAGGSATSETITVTTAALPGTASTGTATSVTHNSASLPFTITDVTGVASITINVYAGASVAKTYSGITPATSGSYSATGLSASTTYTYTITLIGDANHNDKAETSKSTSFTTTAAPTCSGDPSALTSNELYTIDEMVSNCSETAISSTTSGGTGIYQYGLSNNGKFYVVGTTNGDDGSTGTVEMKKQGTGTITVGGETFTYISWFKGAGSTSCRSIKFVTPSAGKLIIYGKVSSKKGNIELKQGSSSAVDVMANSKNGSDSVHVNITAGATCYLWADGASAALYGIYFDKVPELSSSDPADGDTDVPVSGTIVLTFDEAISSVTAAKYSLSEGTISAVAIDGTDAAKVNITYSGLPGSTEVTLSVAAGAVTDAAGNKSAALSAITFTTESTGYAVTAVTSTGDDTYGTVSAAAATVAEGGTTVITATPATGYKVTNWAVEGAGASISPSGASNSNTTTLTMGSADATVTVTFGPKTYTLTLDKNGGSADGEATATYNSHSLSDYSAATNSNPRYNLAGYYTAADGGLEIVTLLGGLTAADDTHDDELEDWVSAFPSRYWIHDNAETLYAHWWRSVNLDANKDHHGKTNGYAKAYLNGSAFEITDAVAGQTGYTLQGFYTAAVGGSKVLNPDGTVVSGNVTDYVTGGKWTNTSEATSLTLYARWAKEFTVTYDDNDATSGTAPAAQEDQPYGTTITVASNSGSLVKTGYTFVGWNTEDDGTGTYYAVGSKFIITDDITLYAQWADCGSGGYEFLLDNASVTQTATSPYKTTLAGVGSFMKKADGSSSIGDLSTFAESGSCHGSTKYFTTGSKVFAIQTANAIDKLTIYAVPTGNDRTISAINVGENMEYGDDIHESCTLTENLNSNGVCGETVIEFPSTLSAGTYIKITLSGNLNVTGALFENSSAGGSCPVDTVAFANMTGFAGSATLPDSLKNVSRGSKISEPVQPTASGYAFAGWYKEGACTNKWDFSTDVVNAKKTLYAKWVAVSGVYTFHYGDGNPTDNTWVIKTFASAGTNTCEVEDFEIPDIEKYPSFFVGYEGAYDTENAKSHIYTWDATYSGAYGTTAYMPIRYNGTGTQSNCPLVSLTNTAEGAKGTMRITTNVNSDNRNVCFIPNGYGLVWERETTALHATPNPAVFETDVVTLTTAEAAGNFEVKLATEDSYVAYSRTATETAEDQLNDRKVEGESYDIAAGTVGRFQINLSKKEDNYGLRFVPLINRTMTSGNWETDNNWTLWRRPNIKETAYVKHATTIKTPTAQAKKVIVDKTAGAGYPRVSIASGYDGVGGLLVEDHIQVLKMVDDEPTLSDETTYSELEINSSQYGTAALIMGEASTTTAAYTTLYTKAMYDVGYGWVNQYIGTPSANGSIYDFYGSYLYVYSPVSSNWVQANRQPSYAMPTFKAYNLMREESAPGSYSFYDPLVFPGITDGKLKELICDDENDETDPEENRRGAYMFANSWTAPIDVKAMEESDFDGSEATIYIFNAGSPAQAASAGDPSQTAVDPGQWVSIPVNAAQYLPENLTVIPSMQAFRIFTTEATASLTLDYKKHVYDPAKNRAAGIEIKPLRAPKHNDAKPNILKLYVEAASGYRDNLYLFERQDFSETFDNGWDGSKMFGISNAPQIYGVNGELKTAINAIPDLEGQQVGFMTGKADSEYTITFNYEGDDTWYFNDTKEHESTLISNDAEYTFTTEPGEDSNRFYISATPIMKVTTGVENVQSDDVQSTNVHKVLINDHIYIIRGGRMYDATGKMLK